MRTLLTAAVVGTLALAGCQDRQSKVQSEQRDVVEAQRDANKDIAEARKDAAEKKAEADKDVQETTAEARKDVAEEQRDVNKAAYKDDALAASGTLTGELKDADDDSLTIEDQYGNNHDLKANSQTKVTVGGRAARLDDLKEGSEVRASYTTQGDDHVASDVTVTSAKASDTKY